MGLRTSAVVVVLALGVLSGTLLLSDGMPGRDVPVDRTHLLGQVIDRVEKSYIDSTTGGELYSFAMIGLLRRLGDPHATYIPATRLALLRERTSGNGVGPGLDIDERDGWIVVVSPHAGSPADRAGVRAGDRIIQVNGRPAIGLSAEEVRLFILGNAGSTVNVTVERRGVAQPIPFALVREAPAAKPVRAAFMLSSAVGYVKLNKFSSETNDALAAVVDSLVARRMETLIVDLRGNPGGSPEDGVGLADLFLPEGSALASTRGRQTPDVQNYQDRTATKWGGDSLELILLVDGGTANGSEIAAGALQDLDRALVIGSSTYGKASRQQLISLSNGGAIMITTSRWFTPLGRSIEPAVALARGRGAGRADSTNRPVEFKTKSGRIVLGGPVGGIRPDVSVKIPADGNTKLSSDFYAAVNAREIMERDASIRVAVSLANLAQGQMELFSRALAADSSPDDEAGR